jgi:hypothetical protein
MEMTLSQLASVIFETSPGFMLIQELVLMYYHLQVWRIRGVTLTVKMELMGEKNSLAHLTMDSSTSSSERVTCMLMMPASMLMS